MINEKTATKIINALRQGVPPLEGIQHYSSNETLQFIENLVEKAIFDLPEQSLIKFAYGDYGAGKTHFLRLLNQELLQNDFVVSFIEMKDHENILGKLEYLAKNVFQNIMTMQQEAPGLAYFFRQNSAKLEYRKLQNEFIRDLKFNQDLLTIANILASSDETDQILKANAWLNMQSNAQDVKDMKIRSKLSSANANSILTSLGRIILEMGYSGLIIIIDEAEKAAQIYSKKIANTIYNNLKSFINTIDDYPGILFIFATTPLFFDKPTDGSQDKSVNINKPLKQRIGMPDNRKPYVEQTIWNIEQFERSSKVLCQIFEKIISIYDHANPKISISTEYREGLIEHMEKIVEEKKSEYGYSLRVYFRNLLRFLDNEFKTIEYTGEIVEEEDGDSGLLSLISKYQSPKS